MKRLAIVPLLALCAACCTHKEVPATSTDQPSGTEGSVAITGPPAIVYRTRVDVADAVPITLSEDGKHVISYPHPRDLRNEAGYTTPTPLGEGYLLDNRGIGPNSVFLRWSYAEYAALDKAPSLEELLSAIEYREPFKEMYDCGARSNYTDPAKELSEIVRVASWSSRCKKLK